MVKRSCGRKDPHELQQRVSRPFLTFLACASYVASRAAVGVWRSIRRDRASGGSVPEEQG